MRNRRGLSTSRALPRIPLCRVSWAILPLPWDDYSSVGNDAMGTLSSLTRLEELFLEAEPSPQEFHLTNLPSVTFPNNSTDFPPAFLPGQTKLQIGLSMTEFTILGLVFISLQLPNPSPALSVITVQRQIRMEMECFPPGSCAGSQTTIPRTICNFSSSNCLFPLSPLSCSTLLCPFYLFLSVPTTHVKML